MKILFLTENFPPETNAAAARVYERALYWVRWGHEVTIVTCAPNFPTGKVFPGFENRWYDVSELGGMRVIRVKTFIAKNEKIVLRTLDFVSFMLSALPAGLLQDRPDVIVATSPQFFTAVGGWLLSELRGIPFVFELSDLWPATIRGVGAIRASSVLSMVERLELFLYRRATRVMALTSAFERDLVRRGISPEKIGVVQNGVELSLYAPRPRDEELAREWDLEGRFVIGYLGTLGMSHDLLRVLEAAERLRDEPKIRFLFVGAGAERDQLAALAREKRLDNVVFMPRQPKERMPAVWSLCDVALVHLKDSPVFAEVLPSKMFEAMGMGIPILLASPKGEASRVLDGCSAGVWVPSGDPEALAEAARRLHREPELTARLAAASRAAAFSHSRENQAAQAIAELERAVGKTAPRPATSAGARS